MFQLVRGGTLAEAGRRLEMDTSSVYRSLKRLEAALKVRLFERSRRGMTPTELALALAARGEAIEAQVVSARELVNPDDAQLMGTVCVSTTEILLAGLLMPALPGFRRAYPGIDLELRVTNQRVRVDRREADVVLRGTSRPPNHLVGANLGTVSSALWASTAYLETLPANAPVERMAWVVPDGDELLSAYGSRAWRTARYPHAVLGTRCDSLLSVALAVEAGLGIAIAPYFLMEGRPGVVPLSDALPELNFDAWLLTNPDVRHRRCVGAFFNHARSHVVVARPGRQSQLLVGCAAEPARMPPST